MKKVIINTLKVISYMILLTGLLVHESVKGLKTAPVIGKIGIVISYAILICSFIFKRPVFFVILGFFLVGLLFMAIYIKKESGDFEENHRQNKNTNIKKPIPFFEGLSKEAAKKEYHRLMRQYHPDNGKFGDLTKTQEIATAYSQYMAQYGR